MTAPTLRTQVYERIVVVNEEGAAIGCLSRTKPYNPQQVEERVKEVVKCALECDSKTRR